MEELIMIKARLEGRIAAAKVIIKNVEDIPSGNELSDLIKIHGQKMKMFLAEEILEEINEILEK